MALDDKTQSYLDFLSFSLCPQERNVPKGVSHLNWSELLAFAKKQCIVGIFWGGILQLSNIDDNKPSEDDVMEWLKDVVKLERRGAILDNKTVEVFNQFRKDGFRCCILKGQTNNRFYPSPYVRTPGDIDIWVEGGRKKLRHYILSKVGHTEVEYHHLDFPLFNDAPVEVHNIPIFSCNLLNNLRIQKYFSSEFVRQMDNNVLLMNKQQVCGLTDDANIIFQLLHMHKHLCTEGLGLRHIIDFYYLLNSAQLSKMDSSRIVSQITAFHLYKFAGGVTYILHTILGLNDEKCIVPENVIEGKYILSQILIGGNFGKYDNRYLEYKNKKRHWSRFVSLMKMLCSRWRHDPYEISWQPLFYIVNFFMMRWYNKK